MIPKTPLVRTLAAGFLCAALSAGPIHAADKQPKGGKTPSIPAPIKLSPPAGPFIVTGDVVNIRAQPDKKSKRLGQVTMGQRVTVEGRVDGAEWYAIRHRDKIPAYVHIEHFLPLLDGDLSAPLTGRFDGGPRTCAYTIRYDSQDAPEDPIMRTADYWIDLRCGDKDQAVTLPLFMFMTEVPYNFDMPAVYQIGVEAFGIDASDDGAIFVNTLFQWNEKTIVFDSGGPEAFITPPTATSYPAAGVPDALRRTLEIALRTWNDAAWTAFETPGTKGN